MGILLFIFHLVDFGKFLIWKVDLQTKKGGHPWYRLYMHMLIC